MMGTVSLGISVAQCLCQRFHASSYPCHLLSPTVHQVLAAALPILYISLSPHAPLRPDILLSTRI